MHPTIETEIKTLPLPEPKSEEPPEFSSYMEENPEEEKDPDTILMDGPVSTPFMQTPPTFKVLASLPKELKPLIEPLPQVLQTSINKGVMQTKIVIELPSSESVEVVVDQYDTAPKAFHISFYGSETTNSLISQKLDILLKTLQTLFPELAFAISPPFYETPSFSLPKTRRFGYSPVKQGKRQK